MDNEMPRENTGRRGSKLRQLLSWATGDRAAEGAALSDRAGPSVSTHDATVAVRRAHGDLGVPAGQEHASDTDANIEDFAGPNDAVAERDDRS